MAKHRSAVLDAHRWQYIVSGVKDPGFNETIGGMITEAHGKQIGAALAPLM